jgi:hypothetical protein
LGVMIKKKGESDRGTRLLGCIAVLYTAIHAMQRALANAEKAPTRPSTGATRSLNSLLD